MCVEICPAVELQYHEMGSTANLPLLRVIPFLNRLVERRSNENLVWEQRRRSVIGVETLPVGCNGTLVQQIGKGCVEAEHLMLVVLVDPTAILPLEPEVL
jgi:hypothetical protein